MSRNKITLPQVEPRAFGRTFSCALVNYAEWPTLDSHLPNRAGFARFYRAGFMP